MSWSLDLKTISGLRKIPIAETLGKPVADVLIVEDQAKLRNNLQELLESCGHATVGASCVTEACQALESTAFDLIILDLGLHGSDGLELSISTNALFAHTVWSTCSSVARRA